jgi:hypothetical protein
LRNIVHTAAADLATFGFSFDTLGLADFVGFAVFGLITLVGAEAFLTFGFEGSTVLDFKTFGVVFNLTGPEAPFGCAKVPALTLRFIPKLIKSSELPERV